MLTIQALCFYYYADFSVPATFKLMLLRPGTPKRLNKNRARYLLDYVNLICLFLQLLNKNFAQNSARAPAGNHAPAGTVLCGTRPSQRKPAGTVLSGTKIIKVSALPA